jgi:hypothetical protein
MEKIYEIALEFVREREETFKNAWNIIRKIKKAAIEILQEAIVYVLEVLQEAIIKFISAMVTF